MGIDPANDLIDYLQSPFSVFFLSFDFLQPAIHQFDNCRAHALADKPGNLPQFVCGLGVFDADCHGISSILAGMLAPNV
jgi:hypothetical protein